MTNNESLIIEGGGMRGFFSAGALQCLIDNEIDIKYVIGISSGSLNAVGYVKGNMDLFFRAAQERTTRFIRPFNLIDVDKGLLDTERFFIPLVNSYEKIIKSDKELYIGATIAEDGSQVYFTKKDFINPEAMINCLRASAALPVLMPKVTLEGKVYVDGGIIDSIPIQKAISDGKTKNLLILTRPKGYVKKRQRMEFFLNRWLKPFPYLKQKILTRHLRYNETMKKIEAMEKEGKVLIIRPESVNLGRTEFSMKKFKKIYNDGYSLVKSRLGEIKKFLEMN